MKTLYYVMNHPIINMKQLRKSLLIPILMYLFILNASAQNTFQLNKTEAKPLDTIIVYASMGIIKVHDGEGRLYFESNSEKQFIVSGSLGTHVVSLHNEKGKELSRATIKVNCKTEIIDKGGRFHKFCNILRLTYLHANRIVFHTDGAIFHVPNTTSRGNALTIRGSRYFMNDVRHGLDLHSRYQRDDGLVWDFAVETLPNMPNQFEWRFQPQFTTRSKDGGTVFARQPGQNDVEHEFIRGIYNLWQCTGDDDWMNSKLDNCLSAMRFSGSNEWFWSDKYKLLKRPYTIDGWDYVSNYDIMTLPTSADHCLAQPGKTVYGVMHGDNTGMADACDKLALMLNFADRYEEAKEASDFADSLRVRLNKIAWNGEFYTHHVSEDPSFKRDFGVDESTQVSLSNSCALNRGISHDKAVAIIKTYQRIQDEKPEASPAEFFMIYPPFQKGWGSFSSTWQYANGSNSGIIAGELARGAFHHGYEEYGADILYRWLGFMEEHGDRMPWGLRGKMPELPERTFQKLDLKNIANADLAAKDDGVAGWMDDPGFDMRELPRGEQTFKDIPFNIIINNNRKSLLRMARSREGFTEQVSIPVNRKTGAVYFLHAFDGGGSIAGEVTFVYADGSSVSKYIETGKDVFNAWHPPVIPGDDKKYLRQDYLKTVIAWRGKCPKFWSIGLTAHGMDNPHPEKEVEQIELKAGAGNVAWLIVAMTLSDAKTFFMPPLEAHGAPEGRQAGALAPALFQGLAGVVDTDRNMRKVTISPRWESADVKDVTCYIKYEDGEGYVAYSYAKTENEILITLAGNSSERLFEILQPQSENIEKIMVNGVPVNFKTNKIENSVYAVFEIYGLNISELQIKLK